MAVPRIGGASVPLPNSGLNNNATVSGVAPFTAGFMNAFSNTVTLAAGEVYNIPAGTWWVTPGPYTFLQWLDPVTTISGNGLWRTKPTSATRADYVESDGSNFRLANMTGCAIGATITSGGAGYPTNGIGAASGVTATASSGSSTWVVIVGGAVAATVTTNTASTGVGNVGAGYNYPPICVIDAPPAGGLQATAHCTLTTGTIPGANVVIDNQGAGYTTAPSLTFIPDPREATATTPGPTTVAVVKLSLTATGQVTGLYPTNHGTALTGVPTIAFAGTSASTSAATALAIMNFTVTSFTLTSASQGASLTTATLITTSNIVLTQGATTLNFLTNPLHAGGITFPRPARIIANVAGGFVTSTGQIIEDAGLGIQQVPGNAWIVGVASVTGNVPISANVTVAVGGTTDTSLVQPS